VSQALSCIVQFSSAFAPFSQLQGEFAAATAQHQQLASQLSAQVQQLQLQQSEAEAQFQRDKSALQTEWTSRVDQLETDLKSANKMLSRAQVRR
jgi:cell shape-determining protein MreC